MPNAKDLNPEQEFLSIMALGDYGTGKSSFATTAPTPGYVFDWDTGILLYKGKDFEYDQFAISPLGWTAFETKFREIRDRVKAGEFKTVVLDSTTSMGDAAMERALQLDPKRSETGGPLWNVHYQHVRNLMEPYLKQFSNWNQYCNVILISHLKMDIDQETGAIIAINPMLTGELKVKCPGWFGEIYQFFTKPKKGGETDFRIRTITRGLYKARSHLSGLDRMLHNEIPNNWAALHASYDVNKKKKEETNN